MLFKEIITVYIENHTKPINTKCSITDCQSRWFIYEYLLLGLKGMIMNIQSLFESLFCFTKLLSMAVVRRFESFLVQTLNHAE
jgi:hypothetical protein